MFYLNIYNETIRYHSSFRNRTRHALTAPKYLTNKRLVDINFIVSEHFYLLLSSSRRREWFKNARWTNTPAAAASANKLHFRKTVYVNHKINIFHIITNCNKNILLFAPFRGGGLVCVCVACVCGPALMRCRLSSVRPRRILRRRHKENCCQICGCQRGGTNARA